MSVENSDLTLAYMYQVQTVTMDSLTKALKEIAKRGRSTVALAFFVAQSVFPVVVLCFASGKGFKKAFVASTLLAGMSTSEYVYLFAEPQSRGFCESEN